MNQRFQSPTAARIGIAVPNVRSAASRCRILLWIAVAGLGLSVWAGEAAPAFDLNDGDRVVFYGDSITQNGDYARFVEAYARSRFPEWKLHFYNAGVGGDTVRGGGAGDIAVRMERDVIRLNPTVVTIMLGMNDGRYRPLDPATLAAFRDGYLAMVTKLKAALPRVRLYLIRPSSFDDFSRPPDFSPGYDQVLRQLGEDVAAIGHEQQVSVVDFGTCLEQGIRRVAAQNRDLARQLLPDRVHPSPAAHLVMGAALLRAWHAPSLVARVEIDAQVGAVIKMEKTQVTALASGTDRLKWTQLDQALPLPLSYVDADTELAQQAGADLESLDFEPLVVTGLRHVRYELRIDDQTIGTFTAAELAAGVNLARFNTPMRWQAYQVRWSAEGAHELHRVIRRAYQGGTDNSALTKAADVLSANDEAEQDTRSRSAIPRAHAFSLEAVP